MIIKFVMKFLPTCLPSGLTVAAPDAFGRIPGVVLFNFFIFALLLIYKVYFYDCSKVLPISDIKSSIKMTMFLNIKRDFYSDVYTILKQN